MALTIDFQGKVVFITGGISGIGLGISRRFVEAGAEIIVCSERNVEDALVKEFIVEMESLNAKYSYFEFDVTDNSKRHNFYMLLASKYKKIDVFISNAGKNVFKGVDDCSESDWDFNFNLNLESHWQLAKLIKPLLQESPSAVVLMMASNHAYSTLNGCFPYNVSKAAMLSMIQSIAIEWAPKIRVLGIAPGFIETEGNQSWFDSFEDPIAAKAETINLHLVQRIGTIEEIGAWCVFLSSEYAGFASGTTYLVDGGRSALMQD